MRSIERTHFCQGIFHFALLLICAHLTAFPSVGQERTAASFLSKVESFRLSGDYAKALELLNSRSFKDIAKNNPILESRYVMELILNYWNSGQVKESENAAKKGLSIPNPGAENEKRFGDILRIHLLYNKAKDLRLNSDFIGSIKSFEEAIAISRKLSPADFELKCLRQMSISYWDQNIFDEFNTLNQRALLIANKINNQKDKGICLNNIGLYYWKISNYSRALDFYEKALELARLTKNQQSESECMNNLGIIYQELGEFDRALIYFFDALSIDKKGFGGGFIAIDLNNIGNTYRKKGLQSGLKKDFLTALDYFENCLSLAEKAEDIKTALRIRNNIGAIYADLEDYSTSIIQYKNGLELAQRINDKESESAILNNLGIVYFNLGDYEESTKYCQMSIDLAQQIKSGTVLWEAFLDIGNAYKKRNKIEEARENYQESIAVIESIRSNIEFEELKASYFGSNKRLEAYHNLIDLLAQSHIKGQARQAGEEAFDYLEKAKARAFLDSLEVAQVNISQGIDIQLANREKQVDWELTALHKMSLTPDLPEEQKEKIRLDIKILEDELEKLKREIRSTSPAYANLKYPKIISLTEARKNLLDGQTAIVAYSVGKDSAYGFAITRKDLSIYPIAPRKLLQEKVANYLKIISDKDSRDFTEGTTLFAELIEPALRPEIKYLIIIPDDALHYLPFETLKIKKDGPWLIEKFAIAYAPSMSSLWEIVKRAESKKEKRTKDLLAFGDPDYGTFGSPALAGQNSQNQSPAENFPQLEYSGIEVQKISAFINAGKKDIRVRDRASEQELKKLPLLDYKLIHFATHGVIDDEKPARSAIVLSLNGDSQEDGFVQMREIYNLRMNADLVSLSACQTGRGQYIQGEGIESLNRAFFYAGASSVLTSLWSINDQASAHIMERFYFHLKNHSTLVGALRAAKIEMIQSRFLAHPYYWAAFLITGDASRTPFNKPLLNLMTVVLAISLAMVSVLAWRIRARGKRTTYVNSVAENPDK